MEIMYAVMPTGGPVRFIDSGGASPARRAVKTTLENLKRWCARLRHGTAARDFKNNQHNRPGRIKIPYGENSTMTIIVDQEEYRNRANENLENELRERQRESLANDNQSETYGAFDDDDDCGCQPGDQWLDRGRATVYPRSVRSGDRRRSSSRRNEDFKVALVALKIT